MGDGCEAERSSRVGLPVGFAGAGEPDAGLRPRFTPRPDRLEAAIETLPGVGPTIARRLARLGLETVGDLLWQRPRRYEEPVPTKRICDLFGDEEAVIEGVVRSATEPKERQAQDPDGARRRRHRRDQGDVVQPALAREQAGAGHARTRPRPRESVRLRRQLLRPRRRVRDRRLRPRLSRERGRLAEEAARASRPCARARP